ncbi:unnamed protein product [Cylindrotheca closterium]|uniref:Uncharacterized protein n=1 Tax=Cylindrotheca closterium TaxID=2856 RepID=A0AAD2GC83_9STRA|nr:unnamed protein product [Cylindrotheca closterium]
MEDWATSSRSQARPPFPFHKSTYPFDGSKVDSTYPFQASDEELLSMYAEERARAQRARFEESKEETKEEDDVLDHRFQTSFIRPGSEQSKEGDDTLDNRFQASSIRARSVESNEETKEEEEFVEMDTGFTQCLDYYEEELEIDPTILPTGSANFCIVHYESYTPPPISWIIQAIYSARHDLRFKLKTPQGAYMLLYTDEIINCVLVLIDEDDGSAYFQIEDLYGNILFADCDQVEAHILYIISTETRKRQATVEHASMDRETFSQNAKPKRRRKHSGPLVSGLRKLSGLVKQCRTSSHSS